MTEQLSVALDPRRSSCCGGGGAGGGICLIADGGEQFQDDKSKMLINLDLVPLDERNFDRPLFVCAGSFNFHTILEQSNYVCGAAVPMIVLEYYREHAATRTELCLH